MTRRIMVDIETLGLEPGAAILSIGAVEFGPREMGRTFEASITRESCEFNGLTVDEETLEWWQEQDDSAQEVLEGGEPLYDALHDFSRWCEGADEVWANSPKFDASMLEAAGDAVDVPMPWAYYQLRDFRTLKSLPVAPEIEQDGVEHDALDDAKHQAHVAGVVLARIEGAASAIPPADSGGESGK